MRFKFKSKTGVGKQYGKRHTPGQMNKTEERYAAILQLRKLAGEIVDWQFEAVKFQLAKLCTYSPDFMIFYPDGRIEFIDVKGSGIIDDKSIVKIKCAAEKFYAFDFVMEIEQAKKSGGGYKRVEY